LVTLIGPSEIRKTRLALQVAEAVAEGFANGVRLVELASLNDSALVPPQVAAALRLRDEPGRPILDTLIHKLRPRQDFLVLDSCEHLPFLYLTEIARI
jgi:predicted ATPase